MADDKQEDKGSKRPSISETDTMWYHHKFGLLDFVSKSPSSIRRTGAVTNLPSQAPTCTSAESSTTTIANMTIDRIASTPINTADTSSNVSIKETVSVPTSITIDIPDSTTLDSSFSTSATMSEPNKKDYYRTASVCIDETTNLSNLSIVNVSTDRIASKPSNTADTKLTDTSSNVLNNMAANMLTNIAVNTSDITSSATATATASAYNKNGVDIYRVTSVGTDKATNLSNLTIANLPIERTNDLTISTTNEEPTVAFSNAFPNKFVDLPECKVSNESNSSTGIPIYIVYVTTAKLRTAATSMKNIFTKKPPNTFPETTTVTNEIDKTTTTVYTEDINNYHTKVEESESAPSSGDVPEVKKVSRPPEPLYRKPLLYLGTVCLLFALGFMLFIILYLTISYHNSLPQNRTLRIITREQWNARPPLMFKPLEHPAPYVVVLHTDTGNCTELEECSSLVYSTQLFHTMVEGWWDIADSFLVGGDGNVYEGRGWDSEGLLAYEYNNRSIGVTFMGTSVNSTPIPVQVDAGQQLIDEGVRLGKISPDYKLVAHRQLRNEYCPEDAMYEMIKTWPHWVKTP